MMRLIRVADRAAGARRAAEEIVRALEGRTDPVLGVATGDSPRQVYRELAAARATGRFATEQLTTVALDEYAGLKPDDPHSYRAYLQQHVSGALGVTPERLLVPDAGRRDHERAAREFEAAIRELGGVDVQILGIGRNGHIGFNEPPAPLDGRTRLVRLADSTRRDNARYFPADREVPDFAMTQGVGTILEADRIVLLAFGGPKADALAAALAGPVTEACPASALQRHRDLCVVADEAALAGIPSRERRTARG